MTREERLQFCKKCLNRKMDFQQGILCSLTGEKATFEGECPDFKVDAAVEPENYEPAITTAQESYLRLSDDQVLKLRSEQSLNLALATGIIVGLIGAILWGAISLATGYQIGYMAIAIGAGVGISMRTMGKGVDQIFGISGAIIAVLSCFIGNFLSIIGYMADYASISYFDALLNFDYGYFFPIMGESFSVIDILFYGLAGYEGYKFSFRVIDPNDI